MGEERLEDLAASLAMVLLRCSRRLEPTELAEAVRITRSQASAYERGRRMVPPQVLESVAAATNFPQPLLAPLLRAIRSFLVAGRGRSLADRALSEGLSLEILALVREAADLTVSSRSHREHTDRPSDARPRGEERGEAEPLLTFLRERCTPADGRLLFEEAEEYRSWPICEQAALLSAARAPDHPREALEWAELAVRIAEQVPGEEAWRWRLLGWALHFLANAQGACEDLPAAERSLALGRDLWEAGSTADPGLLDEAWMPWSAAGLQVSRDQQES